MKNALSSVDETLCELDKVGYVASREIAVVVHLANALKKPVLVEGPAGVGKTELAKAVAKLTGSELIRLQCYEGLDDAKALYEWDYSKQLLYTQLVKDALISETAAAKNLSEAVSKVAAHETAFFHERFLLERPLLKALRSSKPVVLLIDEVDRSDPEFEAMLLEVLSDFQVSVPELGTIRAKHPPFVVLTSNASREMSEALRRRCLHLFVDYPAPSRELEIIRRQVPNISEKLAQKLVELIKNVRALDLDKVPSVSETIDWARTMVLLGAESLDPKLVEDSLSVLAKHKSDQEVILQNLKKNL